MKVTFDISDPDGGTFTCVASVDGAPLGLFETQSVTYPDGGLHQIYAEGHARAFQAFAWHALTAGRLAARAAADADKEGK